MSGENASILLEMRQMLNTLVEEQKQLIEEIKELKAEQKKIQDDIRINNFVLNNIPPRSEIGN